MKTCRAIVPDLDDCRMEDRRAPVIPNLGLIALTTGGYMLLIPFPGALVIPTGSSVGSTPIWAAGVSGTPINTPFFILGSGGISSVLPGNITGVPSLGAGTPAAAAAGLTINVGSGASEAASPLIPLVTRNTVGSGAPSAPTTIGGQPLSTSSLLPPAQPAAAAPASTATPLPTTGTSAGPMMPAPGSSLAGPFVRFPSMFPTSSPLGFPVGTPLPGTSAAPAAINPPPRPGSGQGGLAPPAAPAAGSDE